MLGSLRWAFFNALKTLNKELFYLNLHPNFKYERFLHTHHYNFVSLSCINHRCYMDLTKEELYDIRAAVTYYMHRHVSIKNPRHDDYEVILQKLSKSITETK